MPTKINPQTITNSIVLVRVCYDLPNFQSLDRLVDSQKTIELLLKNNNKVILATHWGRPKSKDLELSLKLQEPLISKMLDTKVEFVDQYDGFFEAEQAIKNSNSKVFILENTRFEENEKSKDTSTREAVAKNYSTLADFFVDEAFAVSHRKEATNFDIKQFLPFSYGLSFENELKNLDKVKTNPEKPFVAIMAGAKLETKLPLVQKILPMVDKLILGGQLCFVFVKVLQDQKNTEYEQAELGNSHIEDAFYTTATELLAKYSDKLVLPVDFVYGDKDGNLVDSDCEEKIAYDLGPKSVAKFQTVLDGSQTVFWNGTLGYYEKTPFNKATLDLANVVTSLPNCFKVIGGGDTNSSMPQDILAKFDFVSMGGGATLDYLAS